MRRPKIDNRRLRFLSKDEADALLVEIKTVSLNLHDECLLALYCGLRAGEIHNLMWGDIDFGNGQILIRDPKNGQNRFAFLTEPVKAMLERRFTRQDKESLLFPTATGKKRAQVSRAFGDCVEKLGLNAGVNDPRQKVVFHTLRHTFASWLVQKGVENAADVLIGEKGFYGLRYVGLFRLVDMAVRAGGKNNGMRTCRQNP